MIRPNSVQLKEEGDYTVEEVTFMGEMTEIRVRVPEKMAPGGSILCQRMEGPGRPAKLRAGMKPDWPWKRKGQCCSGMIWNEGNGAGNGMWWQVMCCGGDCARRGLYRENMDGRRCR